MRPSHKSPSYLVRNQYSYCFRMIVPYDLQPFVGKRELRYSLKTGYLGIAKSKARLLAGLFQHFFYWLRSEGKTMQQNNIDEFKRIVNESMRKLLEMIEIHRGVGLVGKEFSKKQKQLLELNESLGMPVGFYSAEWMNILFKMAENGEDASRQSLINFNHEECENVVQDIIKAQHLDVSKDSAEFMLICREYLKASNKWTKIENNRNKGDYSDDVEAMFPLPGDANIGQLPATKQEPEDKGIRFSELIDLYKEEYKNKKKTKTYLQTYRYFIRVMGDKHIETIGRSTIKEFVERARRLPKNINSFKRYRNKTVDEILEMAIPEKEIIHPNTIDKHTNRLKTLFDDAINMFCVYNGKNPVYKVKIGDGSEDDARVPFTINELSRLFSEENYNSVEKPFQFWCPILALFHGLRRREMAQLYLDDIRMSDDGIWVFDINRNTLDKSLKNKSAKRIVPIHPFVLNELGFLTFVEQLRSKGELRLFPELKDSGEDEGYGKQVGAWFNEIYKRKCKIDLSDGKMRDLHSFRKNWNTILMRRKADWFARKKAMGHSSDEMSDLYFGGHPAKDLFDEIISKIDWEKQLDLSHLKKSQFVQK
jgi:integrase